MEYPILYMDGPKFKLFNTKLFWLWNFYAGFQGGLIMLMIALIFYMNP